MPDNPLASWVADMASKHGFGSSSNAGGGGGGTATGASGAGTAGGTAAHGAAAAGATAGATTGAAGGTATAPGPGGGGAPAAAGGLIPSVPAAVAGSGAKAQADAAEAAAAQAQAVVGKVQPLATEVQTLVQDAQKHEQEATAAKTSVDQAVAGLGAPPPVPPPQGADAKGKYDSSIQISGNMRRAQQDANAKSADAQNQKMAAETAAKNADTKAGQANDKAGEARKQADAAKGHAETAAAAAKQAAAEAAKSKAAADKAAKDDPKKAELQKAAQEDAKEAARAKAAATKAVAAAKQAATSATGAETQAKTAASAKDRAQQAADAVGQSATDIDAKLAPFGQAVTQAETQEAECKNALSAEDAQAVLEKRYEELGGDAELSKALAAEDKEFQTAAEAARAKIKDWQKDRIRELDELKEKLDATVQGGEELNQKLQLWYAREAPISVATNVRVQGLGEKLKTEPAKEVNDLVKVHDANIAKAKSAVEYNEKWLEETRKMRETLKKRYEDVDKAYEPAEKYVKAMGTELDNELEMSSMTLEKKVDFLQTKPRPVRDRIQKQLETRVNQIVAGSIADTMAEKPKFTPEQETFTPDPIDWNPIHSKLTELEGKSLEELQGKDPKLAAIEAEYEAAGGDKALFEKRVAAWKAEVAAREKQDKQASDAYRKESQKLQDRFEKEGTNVTNSEGQRDQLKDTIRRDEARREELLKGVDPVTLVGLSNQERAEVEVLTNAVERNKKKLAAREEILAAQRTAKENAAQLRDQHKERYEAGADDDAYPMPPKPESKDIHDMSLRAKYVELTGKPAPT